MRLFRQTRTRSAGPVVPADLPPEIHEPRERLSEEEAARINANLDRISAALKVIANRRR